MSLTRMAGLIKEPLVHPALYNAWLGHQVDMLGSSRTRFGAGARASAGYWLRCGGRVCGTHPRYPLCWLELARRISDGPMSFGERGQFLCLDLARIDGDQLRSFDRVFAFAVLHHLPDDFAERIVALVGRVLRPQGPFCDHRPVLCPQAIENRKMVD